MRSWTLEVLEIRIRRLRKRMELRFERSARERKILHAALRDRKLGT